MASLLRAGADVNARDLDDCSPFACAARSAFVRVPRILLQNGADVKAPNNNSCLLINALIYGRSDSLQVFLNAGVDCSLKSADGSSVLHYAAWYGDLPALKLLSLADLRGVDPNDGDQGGSTALEIAKQKEHVSSEWLAAFQDLIAISGPNTKDFLCKSNFRVDSFASVQSEESDVFQDAVDY